MCWDAAEPVRGRRTTRHWSRDLQRKARRRGGRRRGTDGRTERVGSKGMHAELSCSDTCSDSYYYFYVLYMHARTRTARAGGQPPRTAASAATAAGSLTAAGPTPAGRYWKRLPRRIEAPCACLSTEPPSRRRRGTRAGRGVGARGEPPRTRARAAKGLGRWYLVLSSDSV